MNPRTLLRNLGFSLLTVLLVAGGLELVARAIERVVGRRLAHVDLETTPILVRDGSGRFVVHADLLAARVFGAPPMAPVSLTSDAPEGVARVLLLGGSSVYNLCWRKGDLRKSLIEAGLGGWRDVEILCGGVNSGGSRAVLHVLQAFLPFGIDVAVVYSGHNEFVDGRLFALSHPTGWRGWAERLAIVRLPARALAVARLGASEMESFAAHDPPPVVRERGDEAPAVEPPRVESSGWWGELVSNDADEIDVEGTLVAYQDRLAEIVRLTRAAGGEVVIGTVPSNLWAPSGRLESQAEGWARFDALRAEGRYVEAAEVADGLLRQLPHVQATSAENAIVRAIASDLDVPLADVLGAVSAAEPHGVPGETLFRDHCHLDDEGNAVWVATVAPVVAGVLRARPPR